MVQPVYANNKKQKGYAVLYIVILVGSAVLAIVVYYSWLASFSLRNEFQMRNSKQARYLADTCGEVALEIIRENESFSGSGNIASIFGGSCEYQVNIIDSQYGEVNATGNFKDAERKVKISIDKSGSALKATSWRDVADF